MSTWRNMYRHELIWILVFTFLGKWQQWWWVLPEINMPFFFRQYNFDLLLLFRRNWLKFAALSKDFSRISTLRNFFKMMTRIKFTCLKILFFFTCRHDTASVVSFLVSYLLTQQCEVICVAVSDVSHWPTVPPNDFGYSDGLFLSTFEDKRQ